MDTSADGTAFELLPPASSGGLAVTNAARRSTAPVLVVLEAAGSGIEPSRVDALVDWLSDPRVFAAIDPALLPRPHHLQRETFRMVPHGVTVLASRVFIAPREAEGSPAHGWPAACGSAGGAGRERGGLQHRLLARAAAGPAADDGAWLPTASVWWSGCAFVRRRWLDLGGSRATGPDRALGMRAAAAGWSTLVRAAQATDVAGAADFAVPVELPLDEHAALTWSAPSSLPAFLRAAVSLPVVALRRLRNAPGGAGAMAWLGEVARLLAALPAAVGRRSAVLRSQRARPAGQQDGAAAAVALAHRGSPSPSSSLAILVLTGRLPRRQVDGSWVLFARLREQARTHRLRVVAFAETAPDPGDVAALREFCADVVVLPLPRERQRGDAHRLVPPRLARDYSAPGLRAAVAAAIAAQPFDVVQVEYVEAAHVAAELLDGIPSVHVVHEALSLHAARVAAAAAPAAQAAARREAARWLHWERRVLPCFRRVVALSAADASWLQRAIPGLRVGVVPSGIDLPARAAGSGAPAPAAPVVAFVGNYQHPPNVDAATWLANEIFPAVRRAQPAATLWLLGRAPTAAIAALGSAPGVVVTGFVPDVEQRLAAATVVAVPVRLGGGLRGKCLEAWALAKAVVATPIACEGFDVIDGEHVLLAQDAPAFAAALLRCLQEPELCQRLGERARELVAARYSVAAAAERFSQVYRELLAERP
jgi:glycosyltransferase involved in cell wall biosynthesis